MKRGPCEGRTPVRGLTSEMGVPRKLWHYQVARPAMPVILYSPIAPDPANRLYKDMRSDDAEYRVIPNASGDQTFPPGRAGAHVVMVVLGCPIAAYIGTRLMDPPEPGVPPRPDPEDRPGRRES
jgi:hypothetical protein